MGDLLTSWTTLLAAVAVGLVVGTFVLPRMPAANCLSDSELGAVTRSVYTKSLGPVMRTCSRHYPELEERALDAAADFFVTYRGDMRRNRAQTNEIFRRVFQEEWRSNLEALLNEATNPILGRAGLLTEEQCRAEIGRVEGMVDQFDYEAVMSTGAARKMFELERQHIPACEN